MVEQNKDMLPQLQEAKEKEDRKKIRDLYISNPYWHSSNRGFHHFLRFAPYYFMVNITAWPHTQYVRLNDIGCVSVACDNQQCPLQRQQLSIETRVRTSGGDFSVV